MKTNLFLVICSIISSTSNLYAIAGASTGGDVNSYQDGKSNLGECAPRAEIEPSIEDSTKKGFFKRLTELSAGNNLPSITLSNAFNVNDVTLEEIEADKAYEIQLDRIRIFESLIASHHLNPVIDLNKELQSLMARFEEEDEQMESDKTRGANWCGHRNIETTTLVKTYEEVCHQECRLVYEAVGEYSNAQTLYWQTKTTKAFECASYNPNDDSDLRPYITAETREVWEDGTFRGCCGNNRQPVRRGSIEQIVSRTNGYKWCEHNYDADTGPGSNYWGGLWMTIYTIEKERDPNGPSATTCSDTVRWREKRCRRVGDYNCHGSIVINKHNPCLNVTAPNGDGNSSDDQQRHP